MPQQPFARRLAAFSLIATLHAGTAAQTFVVDAANGPGTNFTDLPTAVATVPNGAVLDVRPGTYLGFSMAGKGLTILGVGARIQGSIAIGSTLANQPVTLRGLRWNTVPWAVVVDLSNCQGPILLDGLTLPPSPFHWGCMNSCPVAVGVRAVACDQLYVRNCVIECTTEIVGGRAVLESTSIRGEDHAQIYLASSPFGNPARDALTLQMCEVQITGTSSIVGGDGANLGMGSSAPGGNAITATGGMLRVLGGSIIAGFRPPSYTIESTGTALRISPRATLAGAFGLPSQGPQAGNDVMPALRTSSLGGTLGATVVTEPGDLAVLAVGLPGPVVTVPGFTDPFWLDAANHTFASLGVQQATQPVTASVSVPANPAFLGLRLNWQAACQGPQTGFQATNPVVTLVR